MRIGMKERHIIAIGLTNKSIVSEDIYFLMMRERETLELRRSILIMLRHFSKVGLSYWISKNVISLKVSKQSGLCWVDVYSMRRRRRKGLSISKLIKKFGTIDSDAIRTHRYMTSIAMPQMLSATWPSVLRGLSEKTVE